MRFIMTGKIQAIAGEGADQFLDLFVSGQSRTLPEVLPSEQYLRGGCRSMQEEPVLRPSRICLCGFVSNNAVFAFN